MGMFDTVRVKENTVGLVPAEYQTKDFDQNLDVFVIEGDRISLLIDERGGFIEHSDTSIDVRDGALTAVNLEIYTDEYNGVKKWLEYTLDILNNEIIKTSYYDTTIFDREALEFTMDDLSVNVIPKCYRDHTLTEEAKQYSVYQADGAENYTLIFTNLNNPSPELLMGEDLIFVGIINDYDPTDLPLAVW